MPQLKKYIYIKVGVGESESNIGEQDNKKDRKNERKVFKEKMLGN